MIKLLFTPSWQNNFGLAFSGGIDSCATLKFILDGGRKPELFFFHHLTRTSESSLEVVKDYALRYNLKYNVGYLKSQIISNKECEWRNARYEWLNSFNIPIMTAHHLDDALETYIFGFLNNQPEKLIYPKINNIERPFLLNKKEVFIDFAKQHKLVYYEDLSNADLNFNRNKIRREIVPKALEVNPGLYKMIKKMYLKSELLKIVKNTNLKNKNLSK